jgi:VWFA-related protein
MNRINRLALPGCLVAAVISLGSAPAHQQPAKPDDALKLAADLVVLDVEALSKKTRLAVAGLGKDDFVLYEDGAKQYISYFSQDRLPLSIVILLDVSSSIAPNFDRLQVAATTALARLKENDEAALMAFGGTARVVQEFTSNKQLVGNAILTADATGLEQGTDVNEGVYQAATYLETRASPASRRVIIAITDDMTSQNIRTPRSDSSSFRKVHETQAVVCGIIFYSPYKRLLIGQTASIRTYAEATGGKVVAADSKRLDANLTQIIEHLRTRYSLGFVSANDKRDGSFRKIKLEASPQTVQRLGAVEIVTRKGYYARGPKEVTSPKEKKH